MAVHNNSLRTNDRLQQFEETQRPLTEAIRELQVQPKTSTRSKTIHHGKHSLSMTNYALPRFVKMDFSRYSGTKPTEWLNQVEQFF